MNNITLEDLLDLLEEYNPEEIEIVKKAYDYAANLHFGQVRKSGEPYITHPLNVAYILAQMHADRDTIIGGLLHDTLEDTNITKEDIAHDFNKKIANLVDGVTKMSKLSFSNKQDQDYANTKKIILGITDDVRIIIIKLADRLHNMRTLQFKEPFKQKEIALETLELYVPLAYYIGAYKIKSELEDLSLKYLKPDTYKEIEEKRYKIETSNDEYLKEMLYKIQTILSDKNIPNTIRCRTKNIYGIYKRLTEGHKLSDIHDLLALKIMVDEVENCYRTLYLVHREYHPINEMFKDYISDPKTNMYQSLHTTVFGPNDLLVQAQIRTFEMDKINTHGLTAYWDYEKGNAGYVMQKELKNKFQFFNSLLEINSMYKDDKQFVNQVKKELFSELVYVHTTKGDRIELPKGATAVDFAYRLNTNIGNTMVGVFVNGEYVPIDHVLHNKDRVRILTDDLSYGPREDWIDKAHTSLARKKIKEFNRNEGKNL